MTNLAITKRRGGAALPGWAWFILLWCVGCGGAFVVAEVFKVFMNVTLFAVVR
jgi:hypothetical protein